MAWSRRAAAGLGAAVLGLQAATVAAAPVACFGGGLDPCGVSAGVGSIALNSDPADFDELSTWSVAGVDQLAEFEWFFAQGGTTADLGTFTFAGATADDDPFVNAIVVDYTTALFAITLTYALDEGGLDLTQTLEVTNTSAVTQSVDIFAYLDLQLENTPDDDSASFDEASQTLFQEDGASATRVAWTSASPIDGWQLGEDNLDTLVRNGTISSVGDLTGGTTGPSVFGPDDIGFLFGYSVTLAPGETFTLDTGNAAAVPLPASALLLLGGLGALTLAARRRGASARA